MKVIPTISTDLHLKVRVKKLSPKEQKRRQYQKDREAFMKRVYQTLGKNWLSPIAPTGQERNE